MNPAEMPLEIALVVLIEFLFGLGYNAAVAWAHRHRLMHVSHSVVVGVSVTLLIPALAWFDLSMPFWQSGLLLALCFSASGLPMIIGSMRRTVDKDSKKRRKIGNTAGRIRDGIVMDLNALARDIAESSNDKTLMQCLPDFINRIHKLIGSLKTL